MGKFVTLEEVDAYVAKWVPRLHLQDWIIIVRIEDIDEAAGTCEALYTHHTAIIRVHEAMPVCFKKRGGPWTGRETEAVVLHELLHLYEAPYGVQLHDTCTDYSEIDDLATSLRERVLDSVVRVLLEADAAGAWV